MKKTVYTLLLSLSISAQSFAGITDSTEASAVADSTECIVPFQLTFLTPIGSQGIENWNCTNKISINILAGHAGGLDGVELGGFYNGETGDIKGLQAAGFVNFVGGNSQAAQFAGFTNVTLGDIEGMQASGFVNYSGGDVRGGQLAGFINAANGGVKGIQGSGFVNLANGTGTGLQGAGFVNANHGDFSGIQVAGFVNATGGRHSGLQASGFVNAAKKLNGLQIGLINVTDSLEDGVQIGFFNHASNGIHDLEFGSNETFLINAKYKSGSEKFFTFFSGSALASNGKPAWAVGYGIGMRKMLGEKLYIEPSLAANQIHEDQQWNQYYLNMQNRLEVNFGLDLKALRISAGPSFNVWLSDRFENGEMVGSRTIPFQTNIHRGTDIITTMYPGFQAQIAF